MNRDDREKQMAEAEALLADSDASARFAKAFFFGADADERLAGYPLAPSESAADLVGNLRAYCRDHIDAGQIDRDARIPDDVIRGLGDLGVLGACLPTDCGGRGMSQSDYCRIIETLGGHCGSTALFVNAHHSIGPRALVLFGTGEQQRKWLPKLATGESISAFALTEPEAGSDAGNVQTTATPDVQRGGYVLRGEKRWITNGAIAGVLTVMARTPVEGSNATAVSAFLVTPEMPGFEVVEARMEKLGVRGTATSRLAFHDMFVPAENLLGQPGRGLKIALTVLDFGRTTFGASCTGAAKVCFARSQTHAAQRVQFGQPIGEFELVQAKLASMAAGIFATEATTYQTAALIDSGIGDYMLETAMLKVFSTEVLWRILDDTFQIHGGMAYFTDQPLERMIRDARINTIGEGSNDVLRPFIALVGMREVGLSLKGIADAIANPLANLWTLGSFAARRAARFVSSPRVAVRSAELEEDAASLGKQIGRFADAVERLLAQHREEIVDRQHQLARIADVATELFVSRCVLSRLDAAVRSGSDTGGVPLPAALQTGRYYLQAAARRNRRNLQALWDNNDAATTALAATLSNLTAPGATGSLSNRAEAGTIT